MNLYKAFGTDKDLEMRGVWFKIQDEEGEVGFLVRRIGETNSDYVRLLNAKSKPHRRAIQNLTISHEMANRIQLEVFVQTALLDWENVKDKKGKSMPFSHESALQLLTDLPELFNALIEFARDQENYRREEMEEDAKNSLTASSTN